MIFQLYLQYDKTKRIIELRLLHRTFIFAKWSSIQREEQLLYPFILIKISKLQLCIIE